MYKAEKNAVERGLDFSSLMESAGRACAKIIYDAYLTDGEKALIVCGKGKNGGDGFVIARALREKGVDCAVALVCSEPSSGDQQSNYLLLEPIGVDVYDCTDNSDRLKDLLKERKIVVDAVFGTGFKGAPDERLAEIFQTVNVYGKTVISVDLPSGIDSDNPAEHGEYIKPDMTIAISALKPAHVIKPYNVLCGKIKIADIGILDGDYENISETECFTYEDEDIRSLLPKRKSFSNKGDYGKALCVCSSYKMPGAGCMSVNGALRTGCGLVTAAFPQSAYGSVAPKLSPEAVLLPVSDSSEGTYSLTSTYDLQGEIKKCSAALIGCGIGLNSDTKAFTDLFLKEINSPVVIDADALNAVSDNPDKLKDILPPVIITPHPGEMSRLCKKTIDEILKDPVKIACEFADKYGCTVVLKGANTVIASQGGKRACVNVKGNSGLSKGGSGDLLAGIIVSLLAQGMEPFDAACAGVYIHSDCADEVAAESSQRGMLATDIIAHLPKYLGKYE